MHAKRCAALTAALILFSVGTASALPPCPTWFPDFRCDRHGRYDGFVPTMMHPYLFEDPFITTGISVWGLWHEFPDSSILDGGQLWDVAVQARVAITDRIAFIATKDGWVNFQPGLDLLADDKGFTDITVGFKGSLIDDRDKNFILSPSLRFQIPVGRQRRAAGQRRRRLHPRDLDGLGLRALPRDRGFRRPVPGRHGRAEFDALLPPASRLRGTRALRSVRRGRRHHLCRRRQRKYQGEALERCARADRPGAVAAERGSRRGARLREHRLPGCRRVQHRALVGRRARSHQ